MKKFFMLVVLIGLFFALTACGGGGDDSSAGSGASTGSQEEAAPAEEVSVGDPKAGKEQYDMLCVACHGPDGGGVEGLGKPFTTSAFLKEKNDEEMLEFVKVGRPISDPLNTTGVDMPPKGGNPALTEDQILDIIAYVRTLNE